MPKAILVVEDDADIRNAISDIFALEDYRVGTAANGREAIEWLLQNVDDPPGLVLLDLMMPVMDGQTFLKALQESDSLPAKLRTIPVAILSATQTPVSGSVVEYLRKPPSIDELLRLAAKYCR